MGCFSSDEKPERGENGERGCTDVFWLCVYILFWFLMVLIAAFSFVYGNPIRIINGYDSFGNTCGTNNNKRMGNLELSGLDTTDKRFLLFYDLKDLKQSLKICVKQCPKENLRKVEDINRYYKETGVNLCRYDFNYDDFTNRRISDKNALTSSLGPCPALPVYKSKSVLNRCVPESISEITETVMHNIYGFLNDWDTLEQILGDIYQTWKEILYLSFLALFLSLITICILHLLAHLVSYIIMILFTIASIAGTVFLWYTYFDIKYKLNKVNRNMILLESARNETAFFWYALIATIITVIILIIVFAMRKQVSFLADLFKETSKCLLHLPGLFLQPIFTFIILVAFFMFWIFVVLCLATAYYPGTTGIRPNFPNNSSLTTPLSGGEKVEILNNLSIPEKIKRMTVVEYIDPTWVKYMWWVYFIGLIWTSEFIMACEQMVIAGAVAHWFYRHKYKDNSHISYATCKLIKYHLGSVALGSLLITIFKIPRLLMMYLHEKLKLGADKGSECARCGLKCCICCFYCLEKFIRYLNHNAYTVIAIDGVNFCSAASTAFQVLSSHALQVATINGLGDFILFLGKCFVTAVTGSVGLLIFRSRGLDFYAAPTLIVCVFAFFIAHCILSLYEMVLDTVYLCICQSGEAPDDVQMERLGMKQISNNSVQPTELEPIK